MPHIDVERATYLVCSVRNAYTLSVTLGNDLGVELPDIVDLSLFALSGLGAVQPRKWHERLDRELELSEGDRRSILRQLAREPVRGRRPKGR